jgi:putative N-acetylmannosamine-6-phosphate epimerase
VLLTLCKNAGCDFAGTALSGATTSQIYSHRAFDATA